MLVDGKRIGKHVNFKEMEGGQEELGRSHQKKVDLQNNFLLMKFFWMVSHAICAAVLNRVFAIVDSGWMVGRNGKWS